GALGLHVNGDQPAVGPIENIERLLILGRILGAGAEDDAGRAANADVADGGQAVGIVAGPLGGSFAEAAVPRAGGVEDADGAIPGRAPVPVHVAVEAEQLAIGVEADVVGIALPRRVNLGVMPVEIHSGDEAAGRLLAGAESVAVFG